MLVLPRKYILKLEVIKDYEFIRRHLFNMYNYNNFYNCLAIAKKQSIFTLGLKEAFCRNSIILTADTIKRKFSKCQAQADFKVCISSDISSSYKQT